MDENSNPADSGFRIPASDSGMSDGNSGNRGGVGLRGTDSVSPLSMDSHGEDSDHVRSAKSK